MRLRWLIVPIVLLAALLRFSGNGWDGYEHYHPDERYVAWVATSIKAPDSLAALRPQSSTLNPYYWPIDADSECIISENGVRRDFAYGHLPLYLTVLLTRSAERFLPVLYANRPPTCLQADGSLIFTEFDRITASGRALSALFDTLTVVAIYLLGRRLYGEAAGLLAAALLAVTVLHIQSAHFLIVDPAMTFFSVLTLLLLVRALQRNSRRDLLLAGAATGLAVGSKFSAVLLGLPLLVAWLWLQSARPQPLAGRAKSLLLLLFAVLLAFGLTNPYALLDWGCEARTAEMVVGPLTVPSINWRSCYLYNVAKQQQMAGGDSAFPFTRQYNGTTPYLYFIEMQLRWGMGLFAGLAAFIGLAWALWRSTRHISWRSGPRLRPSYRAEAIVLLWTLAFLLLTGSFFVKFMRYWLPLTPFLALYGGAWLSRLRPPRLATALSGVVLLATLLYALAFANIYRQPHPWLLASAWIFDNVPPDSIIAVEQWGDRLPSAILENGLQLSATGMRYEQPPLTWLSGIQRREGNTIFLGDTQDKLANNLQTLAGADYVAIDSNRVFGVVPRLPQLYPLSSAVYPLLFDGTLGYETAFVATRLPQFGGFYLKPDWFSWAAVTPPAAVADHLDRLPGLTLGRVDESFTLYDQPPVIILRNSGRLTATEMQAAVKELVGER